VLTTGFWRTKARSRQPWLDREVRGSPGLVEVFAAPLPEFDGGFAMVSLGLSKRDGKVRVGSDPGPVPVRPGKASRRRGLRLEWRKAGAAGPCGSAAGASRRLGEPVVAPLAQRC
jgi:hypothetical protein